MARVIAKISQYPDRNLYIGGHIGVHDLAENGIHLTKSDIAFSMVRDPIERAISLFFLMRRSPTWFSHIDGLDPNMGFEAFYERCHAGNHYFHNDHCKLLSGHEDAELTIRAITDRFDLVGSTTKIEAFEHQLAALLAGLCPNFRLSVEHANEAWHTREPDGSRTAQAGIAEVVSPCMRGRILDDNAHDMEVVDFIERRHAGLFENGERRAMHTAWLTEGREFATQC